jgi:hypothetical protein
MNDTLKLSFRSIQVRKRLGVAFTVALSQIRQCFVDRISELVFMALLAADALFQRLRGLPPSIDEL